MLSRALQLSRVALAICWTGTLASVAIVAASLGVTAGDHVMPRVWAGAILALFGVKVDVRGRERIESSASYVFIANHRSALDGLVVIQATRRMPRFAVAARLARYPVFGTALRKLGHILVDQSDPAAAYDALKRAAARLGQKYSVFFAPEGTRLPFGAECSDESQLGEFKSGAFVYAQTVGLPVVPIALSGTARVCPPRTLRPNPGRVTIEFGPPFLTAGVEPEALKEEVRSWIHDVLAERSRPSTSSS